MTGSYLNAEPVPASGTHCTLCKVTVGSIYKLYVHQRSPQHRACVEQQNNRRKTALSQRQVRAGPSRKPSVPKHRTAGSRLECARPPPLGQAVILAELGLEPCEPSQVRVPPGQVDWQSALRLPQYMLITRKINSFIAMTTEG